MKPIISLAQIPILIGDINHNLEKAEFYINEAVRRQSQVILLPELWSSGYDLGKCNKYAEANQSIIKDLQYISNANNISIGGSYIVKKHDYYVNAFILCQPNNEQPAEYQKIHLFKLLHEDTHFRGGESLQMTKFDWGIAGLSVCYDLRFPELFRAYRLLDVDVIFLTAQWGKNRSSHWRTLLKARAIENQYFVVAVDAIGVIHNNFLAGYSAVISPWGETIIEANGDDEILLTTELNLSLIEDARNRLPSHEDYRRDIYKKWYS